MKHLSALCLAAALCVTTACGQGDAPTAPKPQTAPAATPPPAATPSPAATATPDPTADLPALRAVSVAGKVIACHQDGKTVPGAECPAEQATLVLAIDPAKPGARTVQSAKIGPGSCGQGTHTDAGPSITLGDAPEIELLANDSKQYRELIAPVVGIKDPASPGFIIDQLMRVDLEGNGTKEVVFSAQQMLGLRRVSGDSVETLLLPDPRGEDKTGVPTIVGLVDVDGDGTLELIAGTGAPLEGLGPQWVGHWLIAAGDKPALLAAAGCEQE